MLKSMRQNAKYFYILFIMVIISFIFWGVGTVDKSGQENVVAEVGKYKISAEEYWQTYDRVLKFYRELYKDKFDEEMQNKLKLKENVLNSLIENRVLLIAAKEYGINVTNAELTEAIRNEPVFMRDGVFDPSVYQNRLRLSRLTPEGYESAKKQEMTAEKMRRMIELSAVLPDTGAPADDQSAKALQEAMLNGEKAKVVKAYVTGLEKQMKIKIYSDRIS